MAGRGGVGKRRCSVHGRIWDIHRGRRHRTPRATTTVEMTIRPTVTLSSHKNAIVGANENVDMTMTEPIPFVFSSFAGFATAAELYASIANPTPPATTTTVTATQQEKKTAVGTMASAKQKAAAAAKAAAKKKQNVKTAARNIRYQQRQHVAEASAAAAAAADDDDVAYGSMNS